MAPQRYFHGGIGGLRPGDVIRPTPGGRHVDRCTFCEARAAGGSVLIGGEAVDGPNGHPDRVYITTERLYAKFYASLAGRGSIYTVAPVGAVCRSTEDPLIESYTCDEAVVLAVVDRAVLLSMSERRRLFRRMGGTTAEFAALYETVAAAVGDGE